MRLSRNAFFRLLAPSLAAACLLSVGCKPADNGGAAGGGSAAAGGEILIGHFASMSGDTSTFGVETDNGVRLAMKEINEAGGILGKKVRVDTQDDQSKPEEAKTVVTGFAADPNVVAVIGEVASTRSLNAAPVLQRAGIPMVSPSSTNPAVTKVGDYIFRVCFIDPFQGSVMAKFAREDLKVSRAAILRDQQSDYSVGLADVFKREFEKLGGTVIKDVSYNAKDHDFRSQLAQVKDAEAIFIPGYYGEVGTIARQARELGIKAPLMGGDGWDSEKLIEGAGGAGKALEGCYFSNHYSKDDKSNERSQKFVEAYTKEYGKAPSGLAALGYDAMMIVADAIKRGGAAERDKIKEALAQTKDYPAVTGDITIDANRNATKPAVVLEIQGAEFVYKKTIQPEAGA
ncbi:MAG TPA: ABC transporter substrate-binding protein [Armatimonadaceae bacterium]|nr:ABC transporter substrate-binding protein [Armatimonadaceae bacterium]